MRAAALATVALSLVAVACAELDPQVQAWLTASDVAVPNNDSPASQSINVAGEPTSGAQQSPGDRSAHGAPHRIEHVGKVRSWAEWELHRRWRLASSFGSVPLHACLPLAPRRGHASFANEIKFVGAACGQQGRTTEPSEGLPPRPPRKGGLATFVGPALSVCVPIVRVRMSRVLFRPAGQQEITPVR